MKDGSCLPLIKEEREKKMAGNTSMSSVPAGSSAVELKLGEHGHFAKKVRVDGGPAFLPRKERAKREKSCPCLSLEVGFSCTPHRHSPAYHTGMQATTSTGVCFPKAPPQGLKIRRLLQYSRPRSTSGISRHCPGGTLSTSGPSLLSC